MTIAQGYARPIASSIIRGVNETGTASCFKLRASGRNKISLRSEVLHFAS